MSVAQVAFQSLTAGLAVYAAGLSTYNAVLARRKDRRSMKVRLSTSMLTLGSQLGPPMLTIEVVNDGHRCLVADAPQLSIAEAPGKTMILMGAMGLNEFPKRLAEGEVGCVRTGYGEIAEGLLSIGLSGTVELTATCKDSTGREYRSEPWKVNVGEWLRIAAA